MADSNQTTRRNPPLAGRPPFATDEPDDVYDDQPTAHRRQRQPKVQENRPDSTYDVYDNYLSARDEAAKQRSSQASGLDDVGLGFLNGDFDDDDSDDETLACPVETKHGMKAEDKVAYAMPSAETQPPPVTIVAPKPGYAAPVSALTDDLSRPEPVATSNGQERQRMPHPERLQLPSGGSPRSPYSPQFVVPPSPTVPSTPHPLLPPITPITPAFALPPPKREGNIKFSDSAILRGKSEEALLPKRGEKGDDFWRRFSMVVKVEDTEGRKGSTWLKKTQGGAARLSRYIWIVGVVLLLAIGGAIGLAWLETHNNPAAAPKALGGSASEGVSFTPTSSKASSSTAVGELSGATGTFLHVSPTNTVAKRKALVEPLPTAEPPEASEYQQRPSVQVLRHRKARRRYLA